MVTRRSPDGRARDACTPGEGCGLVAGPRTVAGDKGVREVPATFQLYRFSDDDLVWWRLVSPNGRGVARMPHGVSALDEALEAVAGVVERLGSLGTVLRLTD